MKKLRLFLANVLKVALVIAIFPLCVGFVLVEVVVGD